MCLKCSMDWHWIERSEKKTLITKFNITEWCVGCFQYDNHSSLSFAPPVAAYKRHQIISNVDCL